MYILYDDRQKMAMPQLFLVLPTFCMLSYFLSSLVILSTYPSLMIRFVLPDPVRLYTPLA